MQIQTIQSRIYSVRGQRVMLDFDLAELYEVENRALKQAVKRNIDRFPDDFMFQLAKQEWQEVITNCDNLPEGVKFSPATPFAFTEQGVSMLSSVLPSPQSLPSRGLCGMGNRVGIPQSPEAETLRGRNMLFRTKIYRQNFKNWKLATIKNSRTCLKQ